MSSKSKVVIPELSIDNLPLAGVVLDTALSSLAEFVNGFDKALTMIDKGVRIVIAKESFFKDPENITNLLKE